MFSKMLQLSTGNWNCIRRIVIEKLIAVTKYQIFIPTVFHQNIIYVDSPIPVYYSRSLNHAHIIYYQVSADVNAGS
jgi:hypothetical protein